MLKQTSTFHAGVMEAHSILKDGQNVLALFSDDAALGFYQREILRGLRERGMSGVVSIDRLQLGDNQDGPVLIFTTLGACRAAEFAEYPALTVWLCLPWQFGNLMAAEGVLGLVAPTDKVLLYTETAR